MLGQPARRIEEVARWLRPDASAEESQRIRYLVGQIAVGLVVSALTAIQGMLDANWLADLVITGFAASMVCGLLLLRVKRVTFCQVARFERVLLAGFLVLICLQTEQLEREQYYWFALVPMTSALVLGQRGAWEGLVDGALGAVAAVGLRASGFHFHAPPPIPLASAIDVGQFLLGFTALAAVFETQRSRHARQAEQAARARGLFLANVSHELRTPMNGVIGLAELLSASPLGPTQLEHLALLRRSGEAMVALINDLLDLTKLEAGQFKLERASVSVQAILHDVSALVASSASARGVSVESSVAPSVPPWIEGDPLRLRQVLLNLLGNAVKFTEHSGVVRVSARWDDGWLELSVEDEGIGMSPEAVSRLFKPFHQADDTTTRRFGGTGLGLAITAQLAQLMGGSVTVTSTPNEGSTFRFRVPASVTSAPVSLQLPVPGGGASLEHGRVLVVEDNPINQVVARGLCERLGFEVEVVQNGQEAVEAVAVRDFRLVLMDCQMPVMDGFEATARIRKLPEPRRQVMIVALTASAYREELDECLAAGMDDTLVKPLTSAALREKLDHLWAAQRVTAM